MVIIDGGHLTNLAFDSVVRNRDVERTELFANYDILPGGLLQAGAIKRDDKPGFSLCRCNCRLFFESQLADGDLAQPEFLDFASGRHGKAVDELPVTRDLVVGDLSIAV